MCALISRNGVEKYVLREGAFNRESFMAFIVSAADENILISGCVLVLDNVRFHHCLEVKNCVESKGVKLFYL